ncbi:hypothetical protein JQU17_12645 [Ponticoccus sp. SC2-23]|uniref:hypothetical protein n=1 Tax=Alexandriicola marinus TaxID=2081710 RepID=UPI000FDAB765|nr:hypothetical protein [Alexandriicola marinus]MBM1221076.1 hypothetical protein [Ponticoccus sp. SC6-9]MBM1225646.1 hypothetical protein [Ponticoccus sp. SC6-15]MBM1227798.1 hypothetical protein [Ponticoccus sp. SC6-38]MBM1234564.1 hypothetical protein [Ponticoccus sp. SC6-45]MBM1238300.1 hypothetical protein [Ponticoccus sp. SC6-49]MBM1243569.1 hypothetical protein [Ponticoccus sp. SC2-64]MBM1248088.1 hypothetical protein [Ponticoccus sp. SC6-42]MBM1252700.1 hypothetical protein [Pontico
MTVFGKSHIAMLGIALGGCVSSGAPEGPLDPGRDPTASTGYAEPGQETFGVTLTDTMQLAGLDLDDESNGVLNLRSAEYALTQVSDTEFTILIDGTTLTLTLDEALDGFYGELDGQAYEVLVFKTSASGQSSFGYLSVTPDEGFDGRYDYGYWATGLNASAETVAALAGRVEYLGNASIAITDSTGNGRWAFGDAVFVADFRRNSVEGHVDIIDNFGSFGTEGRPQVDPATIVFESAEIVGNGFEMNVVIEDGDLGFETLNGDGVASGQFYEADGGVIAGTFSASGIEADLDDDGVSNGMTIQGAFHTESDPG